MAKDVAVGGIVNPANLWGKPLPKTVHKEATKKEKDTGMLPEDEVELDVDAELEADEPSDAELVAEETDTEFVEGGEPAEDEEPSYDDDEDESDENDDVDDVDSAVEPDEKVSKKKRVTTPMAGKKKSMSDHVREEIARRQESGDSLRGVDIVNALAKKGVKVSPAQVSQLLKKEGVSSKARGPRKAKAAAEERSRAAVSTKKDAEPSRIAHKAKPAGVELPMPHLKAAKNFLAAVGDSYEEARRVLELHEQLHEIL
ncbi:hypothetical protein EBZ39_00015 [bacterium]|nr:hypothetical protein [bacterium]